MAHHLFATKIEKDVETPLRSFQQKKEMQNIQNVQGNLHNMARELEDAREKSEKLSKKGAKASTHKVDLAASRLDSAIQQWESQAPFIFESLQALDETRMNQIRDALTQYGTYAGEHAQQLQADAEGVLNGLLDYQTSSEIHHFVSKTTGGRPKPVPQSHKWCVAHATYCWNGAWQGRYDTQDVVNNIGSFAHMGASTCTSFLA